MPRKSLEHLLNVPPALDSDRVRIANIRRVNGKDFKELAFDIGWNNSWRYDEGDRAGNWDAAWVFAKAQAIHYATLTREDAKRIIPLLDENRISEAMPLIAGLGGGSECVLHAQWIITHPDYLGDPATGKGLVELHSWTSTKGRKWKVKLDFNGHEKQTMNFSYEFNPDTMKFELGCWLFSPHALPIEACQHTPGSGDCESEFVLGGNGLFIFRKYATRTSGPVVFKDVRIKFSTRLNLEGVSLYAIEMVRIPEGPFRLGDPTGRDVTASFYDARKKKAGASGKRDLTYEVTAEHEAIKLGEELGFDTDNDLTAEYTDIDLLRIPPEFPKGYQAFYMMKYQVSQGEYAAFMNSLSRGPIRTVRSPYTQGTHRYAIALGGKMQRIAFRPHRPCNWLSWGDSLAFADWTGLRPMTELEYEKACRGSAAPRPGEYAWGTNELEQVSLILGDEGDGNEQAVGNCNYGKGSLEGGDGGQGPIREDAFISSTALQLLAHHSSECPTGKLNIREATGASYWGVLGLSGNLWEFCVTVAKPEGLRFTGEHGTGELAGELFLPDAQAEKRHWPLSNANGVGFRGGSWFTSVQKTRIADRTYASGLPGYIVRSHDTGFRAVRTDPTARKK